MRDPLYICNPRVDCEVCGNRRRQRKSCDACLRTGYARIDLQDSWKLTDQSAAFLVCGGPSLNNVPLDCLQERGVMSLGVNNAAAYARTSAAVFGDPQWKFHSSMFFDPKCLVFAPNAKLVRHVRMQDSDTKEFHVSNYQLKDCPNVYGFCRSGQFHPDTFFSDWYAHWGQGGKQSDRDFTRLATMIMGIRLLHYLGIREIYMLGVDFWMTSEQPYAWGGNKTSGNRIWPKLNKMLVKIKEMSAKAGVSIYNCNPDSRCDIFTYVPYEQAIGTMSEPFGDGVYDLTQWYERGTMEAHKQVRPDPVSAFFA